MSLMALIAAFAAGVYLADRRSGGKVARSIQGAGSDLGRKASEAGSKAEGTIGDLKRRTQDAAEEATFNATHR
jgi:hypothetical protein